LDKVIIGKVLKPRGLAGEVKVSVLTNRFPELNGETVTCGRDLVVRLASIQNGFAYLTFEGIKDVDGADALRGKNVEVARDMIEIDDDEVLASDIIGFAIVGVSGKTLGRLIAVENYGAGDILECAGVAPGSTFSFPNEDNFVVETNMTERKIVVRDERLEVETIL
jgi:16S rRNA processing protein RimM